MRTATQATCQKNTHKQSIREKQLLTALQDIAAMVVSPNDTRADILAHALKAIGKGK